MNRNRRLRRKRLVWVSLLFPSFIFAAVYPYIDAIIIRRIPLGTAVPIEFVNALLSTSSILFGFSSLMVVSKEWLDWRIWTLLVPPLMMIVLSGVSISGLALGSGNAVQVLVLCSATFNANVVSTAFIAGYVALNLPRKRRIR